MTSIESVESAHATVSEMAGVTGIVSADSHVHGTVISEVELIAEVSIPIELERPTYSGSYTVESAAGMQSVIATKGKLMSDNITVLEIPFASVSNDSGGKTVTIGR